MHRAVCLVMALVLAAGVPPLSAQTAVSDPDVSSGIKQVEEGDYDAAILTLDNAARRLSADPARTRELSQAYLYLGIAYLGKGHEAAAKAKFREAVTQLRDLSLSPDEFPPKVIDLFEAAKEEARRSTPAPAPAAPAPTPTPAAKKGGSKTGLILLGVGGAAAAGVGLAAAGGGGGGSATPGARDTRQIKTFTGNLPNNDQKGFEIVASGNGMIEAQVTWTGPGAVLTMDLQDHNPPYNVLAHSSRINDNTAQLVVQVSGPKEYDLIVANYSRGDALMFTVNVKHP